MNKEIIDLLGDKAAYLLEHQCKTVSKDLLHLPGPDFVDRIWSHSDRNNRVLGNIQRLYSTGRLAGTGYLSILPSIRASSTRAARASRRTRSTSTPRTS